jgi:hypothetical protein
MTYESKIIMFIFLVYMQSIQSHSKCEICGINANCLNDTHCICNDYYLSINTIDNKIFPIEINSNVTEDSSLNNNNNYCSYFQLSLKKTFFFSFFLGPLAIDQVYIGNTVVGILKLIIPISLIAVGTMLFYHGKLQNKRAYSIIGKALEFLATILVITWWFIDWILILNNSYNDRNGIGLFNDL